MGLRKHKWCSTAKWRQKISSAVKRYWLRDIARDEQYSFGVDHLIAYVNLSHFGLKMSKMVNFRNVNTVTQTVVVVVVVVDCKVVAKLLQSWLQCCCKVVQSFAKLSAHNPYDQQLSMSLFP